MTVIHRTPAGGTQAMLAELIQRQRARLVRLELMREHFDELLAQEPDNSPDAYVWGPEDQSQLHWREVLRALDRRIARERGRLGEFERAAWGAR